MKPSRYSHFVESDNGVHAVNLLSRAAMELSSEAYEAYLALAGGESYDTDDKTLADFVSSLKQSMFLLDEDFDEIEHIRYRTQQERFDKRQLGLVIAPTMGCNFNCHYCFEHKTDAVLNEVNQTKLVELVSQQLPGRESLSVQWFGGEPLTALPVIEELSHAFMRVAQSVGATYAATVITNGYLMSGEVSNRLAELGVQVAQITLDGDQTQHDRTRFEKRGAGSFTSILENIRQASSLIAIKIRVHVAPYNLISVFHLLDTLAAKGLAPHIAEIYFAPLFNYRPAMTGPAYQTDGKRFMNSKEFSNVQAELLSKALHLGFRIPDWLDVSYGICTAVRDNTLVVDSSGSLMKCYKDVGVAEEAIGTLQKGISPNVNLQKWMKAEIPRDDECRACGFLPVCLGGCSKQWHEAASKDVICTPLKFNSEKMIRLYFEQDQIREKSFHDDL
jgi:uncharacterized protein